MRVGAWAVFGLVLLMMSGCAATQAPPAPTSSAPRPVVPANGAPQVANPLPGNDFVTDPCVVVDAAQATAIGVRDPGKPVVDRCEWASAGAETVFTVRVRTPDGLTWHYRQAEEGMYPLWRPIPDLAGLPAVMHNATVPTGYDGCAVAVGLRDDVALDFELLWSLNAPIRDASVCTEVERHAHDLVTALR